MILPISRKKPGGIRLATALVALALALAAPATAATPPAPGHHVAVAASVTIYSHGYVPHSVTIAAGETVEWVNFDSTTHTVTADNIMFNGRLAPRARWRRSFPQPGTYSYHCMIHPEMRGTLIVS